ncbi:uncharacterized protein EDB91DRAFT_1252806 [Suillus paluster]|uniref:uncharacterized protein n=1 Tax=Suillus paluster TaxID=48578 RepID=UPI001B85D9CD|nr:uncharacterized protein EDB91DRAFT_1252806 [Suillus paluster]KAG1730153.1 hypothetical protein EDB91DRAFT_1252806 [Suillus paluster]
MLAPSSLPPFDFSTALTGLLQLSNTLGPEWLAFYIKLIPMEMLRTELYFLYILLVGRVYPGDLWQIVGLRIVEAQNEESLQSTSGGHERRGIAERTFMEAKWAQCQMEVPLYSQAIEHIEQHWSIALQLNHGVGSFSATSIVAPMICSVALQKRCKGWLKGLELDTPIPAKALSKIINAKIKRPRARKALDLFLRPSVTLLLRSTTNEHPLSFIGPSIPLLSIWVTPDVQKAFDEARGAELTSQAGLIPVYLDINSDHIPQRNMLSEVHLLQVNTRRARAEVEVYTLAIKNACALDDSESDTFIQEEMCYYDAQETIP